MDEAGSTTTTFLFTDIEGSTQLLRAHRADYARILSEHHAILREQFAAFDGREIDNQGDSFFVAFSRARQAVVAAAACQRALTTHSWPGGASVRVRMGVHTGEADLADDRYVGMSVHRAARISAVGHGGQVLVSQTTASLLDDEEADLPGVALRDLGNHRLKDIPRPVRLYQLDIDGLPKTFPKLTSQEPPRRSRRRRAAIVAAVALTVAAAAASASLLTRGAETPPTIEANSVVRIDPAALKAADVVPVGDAPDLVVISGGYVWVTHHILRDIGSDAVRNGGDRTLTRVDPSTGEVTVVGGGLAPCGLTADPSGDVWVANCFGSYPQANVTRVDATTLSFKETWRVPWSSDFYRGLAYGSGSLWVSGGSDNPKSVIQVDPQTGTKKTIRLARNAGALVWSEGYGDLWIANFNDGSLTRLHAATGAANIVDDIQGNPSLAVIDSDTVWVSDWSSPRVARLSAVGSTRSRSVSLPALNGEAGTWNVAAGAGGIWATTPRDHALFRIDPKTNHVTRIAMPYLPSGVAADDDDVWVTVRGT